MKRLVIAVSLAGVGGAVVVRRRRAARAEQLLWDQAAATPAVRDLR